ncbi:MAG: LysR family transcriptional regulator [Lachnospiraceae bacterium]
MKSTYQYYYIFYHVAKYESFTKAAKVLSSNQPNVTHAMNKLENELGCRLFIRSHKGITLTEEGKMLYHRAAIAFEQLSMAENELSMSTEPVSGIVTIGASETALHGFLLQSLRSFYEQFPGIHIRILNLSVADAVESVRTGKVDFSIVATPTGSKSPLKEVPLYQFSDILIAGTKFSHLADTAKNLRDVTGYPWVCMLENTRTYDIYHQFFYKLGLTLNPEIELSTTDLLVPAIKNNLGIGFVPSFYAKTCLESGECVEIKLKEVLPVRSICIVQDTGRTLTAAAKEFFQYLKKQRIELE